LCYFIIFIVIIIIVLIIIVVFVIVIIDITSVINIVVILSVLLLLYLLLLLLSLLFLLLLFLVIFFFSQSMTREAPGMNRISPSSDVMSLFRHDRHHSLNDDDDSSSEDEDIDDQFLLQFFKRISSSFIKASKALVDQKEPIVAACGDVPLSVYLRMFPKQNSLTRHEEEEILATKVSCHYYG
jgi:hypothetical protein